MSEADTAPTTDAPAVFERYVSALNMRRLDEIAAVVAEHVEHNGDSMSREAWWTERVATNIMAVPDLRWHVDDVVVAYDRVCVRYTDTGTPVRRFAGCEATGAAVTFGEYCFYRIAGGRIVETWSLVDEAAIHRQLQHGVDDRAN